MSRSGFFFFFSRNQRLLWKKKESGWILAPEGAMKNLPELSEKIREKKEVGIVLFGDSICCGWDLE